MGKSKRNRFSSKNQRRRKISCRKKGKVNGIAKRLLAIICIAALVGLVVYFHHSQSAFTQNQKVEENTRNIARLEKDMGEIKMDMKRLTERFDDFMLKNFEMMLEMRGLLASISKDESVTISLTNIGNPTTDSSSSATSESMTSQEAVSSCRPTKPKATNVRVGDIPKGKDTT